MMSDWLFLLFAASAILPSAYSIQLNISDDASIRKAAATAAYGLMSLYHNNQTTTAATDVGTFGLPIYWWESGAVWGGMVDYWAYTGDTSHTRTTTQALLAQVGPNADLMVPQHKGDEGNDDQAFWALGLMSAVEQRFPNPPSDQPQWLDIVVAAFNTMIPRWDMTSCAGGLKWQIYPENAYGYDYKNSISNGGLFQLAARLARFTSNETYFQWAEKVWDWCESIGLIGDHYEIFDGTDDLKNCTEINHIRWTYNLGMFIYGAAAMYNHSSSDLWKTRTQGLLNSASIFFSPYKNSTGVMFESACETIWTCNTDQFSFKAYLSRWLAKTTIIAPSTAPKIRPLLEKSALGAAKACSGGTDETTCGLRWYTGGFDGVSGVGQQLSALEVFQSLLVSKAQAPGAEAAAEDKAYTFQGTSARLTGSLRRVKRGFLGTLVT